MELPISPESTDSTLRGINIAAAFATVLVLFLSVGNGLQHLNLGFGLWFCEIFVFLAVPWIFFAHSGVSPLRAAGASPFRLKLLGLGLLIGSLNFFAAVAPLQWISQSLVPDWMREMYDGSRIFSHRSRPEIAALVMGVGLAAPFCEEFFFRGTFQNSLSKRIFTPTIALLFSAGVFSAFHFDPVGFAARFELGILFGSLYARTRSLWPAVGAHAANNGVSTLLFFAARHSPGNPFHENAGSLVALAIGCGLLLWLTLSRVQDPVMPDHSLTKEISAFPPVRSWYEVAWPWIVAGCLSLGLGLSFR